LIISNYLFGDFVIGSYVQLGNSASDNNLLGKFVSSLSLSLFLFSFSQHRSRELTLPNAVYLATSSPGHAVYATSISERANKYSLRLVKNTSSVASSKKIIKIMYTMAAFLLGDTN